MLVDTARRLGFERGGAFAYSQEDGTPAADFEEQVDEELKLDVTDVTDVTGVRM